MTTSEQNTQMPKPDAAYIDGLESPRLISRFLNEADEAAWSEFFEDEAAVALFPPPFYQPGTNNAAVWIQRSMRRYAAGEYGLQAIVSKETGELAGLCGLILQEVAGEKELEVGYHMLRRHWGKGYAPEAARMFIDYAFENHLAPSLISIIDIRNAASQRVAEKNGFTIDKRLRWGVQDVFIYRLRNPA